MTLVRKKKIRFFQKTSLESNGLWLSLIFPRLDNSARCISVEQHGEKKDKDECDAKEKGMVNQHDLCESNMIASFLGLCLSFGRNFLLRLEKV